MTNVKHSVNDYVTIECVDAGKPYSFTDKKTGKLVEGVSKETIKITTPYGSLKFKPSEMIGIWASFKNKELVAEVERRAKA